MEVIATVKFTNAGEAEVFVKKLREYPIEEAEMVKVARQIDDNDDIVLVQAVGKKTVKGILAAMAEAIRVRKPRKPKKNN